MRLGYEQPERGGKLSAGSTTYTSQIGTTCGEVGAASRISPSQLRPAACGHAASADKSIRDQLSSSSILVPQK